jgi:hypothetical protein
MKVRQLLFNLRKLDPDAEIFFEGFDGGMDIYDWEVKWCDKPCFEIDDYDKVIYMKGDINED